MRSAAVALAATMALALAACSKGPPAPKPVETEVPENLRAPQLPRPVGAGEGTPMNERVAVIGVLNKRNNLSRDF